jgi:hypothetical protein
MPIELVPEAARYAAFSLLTLVLWRATGMPLLAVGAAVFLGTVDASRPAADASQFLASLAGTIATAGLLFTQRKSECAE